MARTGSAITPSRPVLTTAEKLANQQKLLNLAVDIHTTHNDFQSSIVKMKKNHGRTDKWIRGQLSVMRSTNRRRGPNTWNAFVSQKMMQRNKNIATSGKPDQLQNILGSADLSAEYRALSTSERNSMLQELKTATVENIKVVRSKPKALAKKYSSAMNDQKTQWTGLCRDLGIEGLFIAVRGSLEDYHQPEVFVSEKALAFLSNVLKITPQTLALKLEAFTVSGLADNLTPASNDGLNRQKLVSKCRNIIQNGLDDLLAELGRGSHPKTRRRIRVPMNYEKYEAKIVKKHGVALVHWPFDEIINPGLLSSKEKVQVLADALEKGGCKWVALKDGDTTTGIRKSKGFTKKKDEVEISDSEVEAD